jgi:hypothetical protein
MELVEYDNSLDVRFSATERAMVRVRTATVGGKDSDFGAKTVTFGARTASAEISQ